MEKTVIEVVSMETGLVVDTVDCHDKSDEQVRRVARGIAINMADEFFTRIAKVPA